MTEMFADATQEQMNIIRDTEGYQRVCAVPGSGKTFTIIRRMAYLVTRLYVDPSSIHAITFTNKAARQMTTRLKKLIGDEADCFTGTFHGKCNEILKEEIHKLSYPRTFTILDKEKQIDLIRLVAEEQKISLKDNTARYYMDKIAEKKLDINYVSRYMAGADKTELLADIAAAAGDGDRMYLNYLLKQRDNYALDFNDLMMFALHLLLTDSDVLHRWQDRCQYILCDEYQDVNMQQDLLLELLSGKFHNLTVVGDDDQCIYGWRGSKVDYIVNFQQKYPGAKDFYLSENFRSTPEIVDAANSLIASNQNRVCKKMVTNNPHGTKPVYINTKREKDEALWIADTILGAVASGKKYSDHSVLVRASGQSRALEEAFVQKGIPYKILSGAAFYGSEEIKTVLAYLRMVYSLNDLDFEWTIKRPRRGYGKKSLEQLREYAAQRGMTLMEALGDQIQSGLVKKREVIDYYNDIMKLHREHPRYSSREIAKQALDFGYRSELMQDVDQRRIDNVTELLVNIGSLEEENGVDLSLEELLAHFALFSGQDDDSDRDVVRIMTIHTAKGLEFDTVFVNGLVEGQFPSKRLKNQDELEEERRLFYVAVTRAVHKLYLSSYEWKADFFAAHQSSFLQDIDVNCLDCINGSRISGSYRTPEMLPKAVFQAGDRVSLNEFGPGTVVRADEGSQTYDIMFDRFSGAVRRIQFRAPLEKI